MDTELHDELAIAFSWLSQMLAQLHDKKPYTMPYGKDPIGDLHAIEALRGKLEGAGYQVPLIVSVQIDPLGAMAGWRDYLQTILIIH